MRLRSNAIHFIEKDRLAGLVNRQRKAEGMPTDTWFHALYLKAIKPYPTEDWPWFLQQNHGGLMQSFLRDLGTPAWHNRTNQVFDTRLQFTDRRYLKPPTAVENTNYES